MPFIRRYIGIFFCVCVMGGGAGAFFTVADDFGVRIWEEDLVLPTYLTRDASEFPIFFNGRAYQGAQGKVYPYPFLDELTDEKRDVAYRAVYLENEYLRVCVLPELGGRIFSARDKTNGYELFYRQSVVKPALIGMLGAWLSGGVEWNVPHHHRATAFIPVDYALEDNPDGSKTIWIGELELRHRTTWAIGLTLHPGRSCLQSTVRIENRTPLAHSMLYWANVAVHTNEDYQVIFPPDTKFATYHGKNQFAHWPVARERYNRVDYSEGVDISWWKNHPAPTSFFAWNYWDDFLAGYDHGKQAGVMHVADHNVMPGKKFWTWGTAEQGRRWDTILSDTDGPYLELMVGAYSDNQPDYSWIKPYEIRTVSHFWYPIRDMGGAKAANLEAALNLEAGDGKVQIGVNVTRTRKAARIVLMAGERELYAEDVDVSPGKPYAREVVLGSSFDPDDLELTLESEGDVVLSYSPKPPQDEEAPEAVVPPPPPEEIATTEELYLAGLRLEQFHNPTRDPYPYYREALNRDPEDARTNTQLGKYFIKKQMFDAAEFHLKTAIKRLSRNHTRPSDCEAYYYLGYSQRYAEYFPPAIDSFQRAAWDSAWRAPACLNLAEMACAEGRYEEALRFLDRAGSQGGHLAKALQLRAAFLRRLGEPDRAIVIARSVLELNPLDFLARNELYLASLESGDLGGAEETLVRLTELMRGEVQSYLELALDYMACGLDREAKDVLLRFISSTGKEHPLVLYSLGFLEDRGGDRSAARKFIKHASRVEPTRSFPFRLEMFRILLNAFQYNPRDARAAYYLGNNQFEVLPEEGIKYWEMARELGEDYFMLYRNLGLAYARVRNDEQKAVANLERAMAIDPSHPRLYYELDRMYETLGESPEKRLALLEQNLEVVSQRDDALTQVIKLLVQLGRYDRALELLAGHHFHVWEGGGQIHNFHVHAHLLRGGEFFRKGQYDKALQDFRRADEYPANLDVGRPVHGGRRAQVWYFIGTALEALGRNAEAEKAYLVSAAHGRGWSELSYYQGLSLRKLGREREADSKFLGLAEFAERRITASPAMDFFTKFGEKQSAAAQKAQSIYLLGLAHLGLGQRSNAQESFQQAVALNPHHFWAAHFLSRLSK
jgi:tetratricopeptide (TPR) repeat protein